MRSYFSIIQFCPSSTVHEIEVLRKCPPCSGAVSTVFQQLQTMIEGDYPVTGSLCSSTNSFKQVKRDTETGLSDKLEASAAESKTLSTPPP